MKILLDIDGVMVTTPPWRALEIETDGFVKFNESASTNLARIINDTKASIVLTTTHRVRYSIDQWKELFNVRGIYPSSISKVNDLPSINNNSRANEIKEWIDNNGNGEIFVVIDDDLSINGLPGEIRKRCVLTKPLIGLDAQAAEEVLRILRGE